MAGKQRDDRIRCSFCGKNQETGSQTDRGLKGIYL